MTIRVATRPVAPTTPGQQPAKLAAWVLGAKPLEANLRRILVG